MHSADHILILGAGFAGIGMAIRLKQAGIDDFTILEASGRVGGTWRDNAYPGAACDIESHLYSFSFEPNPSWSRMFAPQAEILAYLERCVEKYGLGPHIRLGAAAKGAAFDDRTGHWNVLTSQGDTVRARVVVSGTGPLSQPSMPDIAGLDSFGGRAFHSSRWAHDFSLEGKRVAVVGTGASAIQIVPELQPRVAALTVFQRTPPWIVPRMDYRISPAAQERFRRRPGLQKLVRWWQYWTREATVLGFIGWPSVSWYADRVARKHLAAQVPDPDLRARLTPRYAIGCKRILLSDEWYPAIQQPNVTLVHHAVREVTPRGVVAADGTEHAVDAIVLGTGFKVTAHPGFDHFEGRDGVTIGDVWRRDGMAAYRGTTVAGFPNLFMMTGPNTGLGHSSMVLMMESQFAYVVDALRTMDRTGLRTVEPDLAAQQRYNDRLQQRLQRTVWSTGGCASWYLDERGRNPTLWPGSTWRFRLQTRRFDADAYRVTRRAGVPVA